MQRRDFLKRASLAATLPLALFQAESWGRALLRGTSTASAAQLSPSQLKLVDAIAEGIIPATDTPGARAAQVPAFIGLLYAERFTEQEQADFRAGLKVLTDEAQSVHLQSFENCSGAQQLQLLKRWDASAVAAREQKAPATFFAQLRSLVIVAYYTSSVGWDTELKVRFGGGGDTPDGPVFPGSPF